MSPPSIERLVITAPVFRAVAISARDIGFSVGAGSGRRLPASSPWAAEGRNRSAIARTNQPLAVVFGDVVSRSLIPMLDSNNRHGLWTREYWQCCQESKSRSRARLCQKSLAGHFRNK